MIGDVKGKSILVIGGTRGIGLAIARRMVESGAFVGITGRDRKTTEGVAKSLGANAAGYALDVTDHRAIDDVVRRFDAERNGADGVVYSAGISPAFTSGEKLDVADWDSILNVNLTGAFVASTAFARHAIERDRAGSIVLVGSIAGTAGAARLTAYSVSKAGLIGLAKSLALDWARYKIRVNVLAPGWVETDMTTGVRSSDSLSNWIKSRTPQGRMAKPEEIADMAAFLVSDSASFATGAVFTLDGGWTSG
ncbi:MAG TPA: SDR family oxidoreductase [Candidatus Eremiobacteraceae bacterium]|nr:SDR family oxidoreductase [Candidatus Eremiobacteraceae bacterium]